MYIIDNSQPSVIYSSQLYNDALHDASTNSNATHLSNIIDDNDTYQGLNWAGNQSALMIYTSGTTGRPKGAIHTASSLTAQARVLALLIVCLGC